MRSGFKKFKRKINRGVFCKSLMLGLSLALVAAAAVLLLGKLNVIEDNPILALAVGGGVGAFAFVLWCILLTPRAKAAAKLVDSELKLNEKAQTMLAFQHERRNSMVKLQRRETEKLLRKLPLDFYVVKRIWVYAVILVLSLALCSFAYLVPDKEVPPAPPAPETPFELTEWQEMALINLIEDVEESALRDSAKAAVTDELEGLLGQLRITKLDKQMRALVIGAIKNINLAINEANTYDEIIAAIRQSEAAGMSELAETIGTPQAPIPTEKLEALRALFAEGGTEEINSALVLLGTDIAITLGRISPTSDPFVASLYAFSDGLFDISDNISDYDGDGIQSALNSLFAAFKLSLGVGLEEQRINSEVGIYTVDRLMEIFGISKEELPPEVEEEINRPTGDTEETEPPDDDEEQKGDSGGYGSGDMIYGSDDVIYYPDEEKYVQYGEVIDEYYAKITEKILAGEISEELAASLQKYFESLYDGAAKEDGQGE